MHRDWNICILETFWFTIFSPHPITTVVYLITFIEKNICRKISNQHFYIFFINTFLNHKERYDKYFCKQIWLNIKKKKCFDLLFLVHFPITLLLYNFIQCIVYFTIIIIFFFIKCYIFFIKKFWYNKSLCKQILHRGRIPLIVLNYIKIYESH